MSRRVITEQSIFDQYAVIKPQLDTVSKKEKELKEKIKSHFIENGLSEFDGNGYKLTMSKTDNTSIDMDKLIMLLLTEYNKSDLINKGVFEEKLCVNEERLQELIYEKEIRGELLTDCLIHKSPTYTLRFKGVNK